MRTRARIKIVGFVAGAALIGGVAYASIPDAAGVYTACKLNAVGTIRLIDPSLPSSSLLSHCTNFETQISWNQRGVKGDPGSPGTNGTDGARGDSCLPTNLACVGPKGEKGDAGIAGKDGAKGDPCLPTDFACIGPKGDKGDTGTVGPQGPPGAGGGTLANLDSLGGVGCNAAGTPGGIVVTYGPPPGGAVTLRCQPTSMYSLTVATRGRGNGTVTSDVGGINCGVQEMSSCDAVYTTGTVVTLTATSSTGVFTGWSGACSGTGACTVTMNADADVTANFEPGATLTVVQSGGALHQICGLTTCTTNPAPSGVGIKSSPAGISCSYGFAPGQSGTCVYRFEVGTVVTLNLDVPFTGHLGIFLGGHSETWGGACQGASSTAGCVLTLDADKSVTMVYSG